MTLSACVSMTNVSVTFKNRAEDQELLGRKFASIRLENKLNKSVSK